MLRACCPTYLRILVEQLATYIYIYIYIYIIIIITILIIIIIMIIIMIIMMIIIMIIMIFVEQLAIRPVHLLRVWVSEGLTQANS